MSLYAIHSAGTASAVYVFPENTPPGGTPSGSDVRTFPMPTGLTFPSACVLSLDGSELLITDDSGEEVFFVNEDTPDGTIPIPTRKIFLPPSIGAPLGIAISSAGLHIADNTSKAIYLLPTTKPNETTDANGTTIVVLLDSDIIKTINMPTVITVVQGLSISGDELVITDSANDALFFVPIATLNNQIGTLTRQVNFPSQIGLPRGVAIDSSGNAYVGDSQDDDIYHIPTTKADETTQNGTTIVNLLSSDIILNFNLPSGCTGLNGLAFRIPPVPVATIASSQHFLRRRFRRYCY